MGARFAVLMVSAILASGAPASADPCRNVDGQFEAINCYRDAAEAEDRELNRIWPKVKAEINGLNLDAARRDEWQAALLASQRAWIKFKEAECALQPLEFVLPGAYQAVAEQSCLYEVTRRRVDRLKQVYEIK